eukprot:538240-Pleurochrysis_carterae.AAC.1
MSWLQFPGNGDQPLSSATSPAPVPVLRAGTLRKSASSCEYSTFVVMVVRSPPPLARVSFKMAPEASPARRLTEIELRRRLREIETPSAAVRPAKTSALVS